MKSFYPNSNQVRGLIRFAEFFLSPSSSQRKKRRHWRQNEKIIRRHDKNIDRSEIIGTRLQDGFIFDLNGIGVEDRDSLLNLFNRHKSRNEEIVDFYVPLIDDSIARVIRSIIDKYLHDMRIYLGQSLRLDNYYFHATTPKSRGSVSSSWHTDNIGHRLKMFITLQSDGKVPTGYLPGSNRKLYRRPIVEQFRFFLESLTIARRKTRS
jgi:hypothetical protein